MNTNFYVEPVIPNAEKVKFFNGDTCAELTDEINEFIKDKILVDIKMSAHTYSVTIIVIYKEFPF